jgi:hypothetical protein
MAEERSVWPVCRKQLEQPEQSWRSTGLFLLGATRGQGLQWARLPSSARGDQRPGAPVGPSTQFCQVGGKGRRKALLLFSAAHGPLLKLGCGMAPLMEHVFAEGQRDPGANPRSRMSSEPGCFWG